MDNLVQCALVQYFSAQHPVKWKWSRPSKNVWDCASLNNIYIHIPAYLHVCVHISSQRSIANVGHLQFSTLKIKTILISSSRHYSKFPAASALACSHLNTMHGFYKIISYEVLWPFVKVYACECNLKLFRILSPVMCVTTWLYYVVLVREICQISNYHTAALCWTS